MKYHHKSPSPKPRMIVREKNDTGKFVLRDKTQYYKYLESRYIPGNSKNHVLGRAS